MNPNFLTEKRIILIKGETTMATTVFEEIRTTGEKLLDELRRIIAEGNAKKILIKNSHGKILFDVPLTLGAVGMGGLFVFFPILSAVGAFTAFANDIRIEVERMDDSNVKHDDPKEVDADIINIEED